MAALTLQNDTALGEGTLTSEAPTPEFASNRLHRGADSNSCPQNTLTTRPSATRGQIPALSHPRQANRPYNPPCIGHTVPSGTGTAPPPFFEITQYLARKARKRNLSIRRDATDNPLGPVISILATRSIPLRLTREGSLGTLVIEQRIASAFESCVLVE